MTSDFFAAISPLTSFGSPAVTFDRPPDISSLESATYLEAINYFCEVTAEKLLEGIRAGRLDQSGEVKNTVLVLPKLPRSVCPLTHRL